MISVISIGTDRQVFQEGSAVRERLLKQRAFFKELHVIVFARRAAGFRAEQLGNLWLYPTNSLHKLLYVRGAAELGRGIAQVRGMTAQNAVVTAQDPFECGLSGLRVARKSGLPLQVAFRSLRTKPVTFAPVFWISEMALIMESRFVEPA